MKLRLLDKSDMQSLKKIHEKHYKEEFELPDFLTKYLSAFVVEDSQSIICAAGVRTITEAIALTNKDRTPSERREALYKVLRASMFISKKCGYDQLHAFIQDEKWMNHLIDAGFRLTRGRSIVIDTDF